MQPDLDTDIHIVEHVVTPSRDDTFAVNCPESLPHDDLQRTAARHEWMRSRPAPKL